MSATRSEADLQLHKYVVLKDPADGGERALVFSRQLRHADLVPAGFKPVGAGFVYLLPEVRVLEVGSDSLGIGPRRKDRTLLAAFLNQNE